MQQRIVVLLFWSTMWGFDFETTLFGGSMFSFVIGTLFCDEVIDPPQGPLGRSPKRIVSESDSDQNWKKRTKDQ